MIKDRFIFNAVVSGYYDIDTPNEYAEFEPQIYLENVDILNSGDIGISRDDLEIAIQKQYPNIDKSQFNQIMQYFEDNSCSSDNEAYLTILPDKIIQSTGLKDKNGTLIYEGDIVKSYFFDDDDKLEFSLMTVEHLDKSCAFVFQGVKTRDFQDLVTCEYIAEEYEVIGNIYENKDLLNEV